MELLEILQTVREEFMREPQGGLCHIARFHLTDSEERIFHDFLYEDRAGQKVFYTASDMETSMRGQFMWKFNDAKSRFKWLDKNIDIIINSELKIEYKPKTKENMKAILNYITYPFLVIWYFIIGTENQEVKEFVSPLSEPIEIPTPIVGEYSKRKWTRQEILIAMYIWKYDIQNLGLTINLIAGSIRRSEASLIRKMYRFDGLRIFDTRTEYSTLDLNVHLDIINLTEQDFRLAFYEALIEVSIEAQTGVTEYFEMRKAGDESLRDS